MENEEDEIKDEGEILHKVFEFNPDGSCRFRQRGPYLVCVSCEVQHAVWIGMNKMMVGEDENGKPVLKSR